MRRSNAAWGLFLTLLFILSHAKLFLLGEQTVTHDSRNWFTLFAWLSDGIRNGIVPAWAPYSNTGEPCAHLPGIFRCYDPGTVLTMWLGGKIGIPLLTQYHVDFLRRFVFLALGSALLVSRFSKHPRTPLFAYAVTLFFSLPVAAFRQNAFLYDAYTLPFFLYFYHRLMDGPVRRSDVFLCAFFLGTGIANYRAPCFLLYVVLYAGFNAVLSGGRPRLGLKGAAGALLVSLACTAPLWDLLRQHGNLVPVLREASGTGGGILKVAFGHGGSTGSMMDLASLLCPCWGFVYHVLRTEASLTNEGMYYAGILTMVLALAALHASPQRVKWVWLAMLLALSSLILGAASPLAYLAHHAFPSFSLVRNYMHFHPFLLLTIVWLGSLGADRLLLVLDSGKRRDLSLAFRFLTWGILAYAALMFVVSEGFIRLHRLWLEPETCSRLVHFFHFMLFLCLATLGAAALLLWLASRRRLSPRAFLLAGGTLLLLDLMTVQRILAGFTLSDRAPHEVRMAPGYRFENRRLFSPEAYAGKDARALREEYAYLPLIEKRPYAFDGDARKYLLESRDYAMLRRGIRSPEVFSSLLAISTPILRFDPSFAVMDRERYLEALKGPQGPALARQVCIHDTDLRTSMSTIPTLEPRVLAFSPGRLETEVDAPERGVLYYADQFHSGWRARVDGRETHVLRANFAYKAVLLEAGRHRVEFRFESPLFRWGLLMFYAMHAVALALAARAWRRGWSRAG